MAEAFLLGITSGFALAIPMGPMALLLMQTTLQRGRSHGVAGGLSMGLVDGAYALLAATAGLWLSRTLAGWTSWIEGLGGLLLLALALDIWRRAWRNFRKSADASREPISERSATASVASVLATGLKFSGATILNPPTALYFLAIAPILGAYAASADSLWVTSISFAFGVWLASSIWQQLVVAASQWLGGRVSPVWRYAIASIGALVILGFGVTAIWLALS